MQLTLQILGSVLLVVVLFIYLNQIKNNQSTPNPGTWSVLFIIMGINAITYLTVVNGDYLKATIVFVSFLMICTITLYTFIKGKFAKISTFDKWTLFVSVLVGIFWQTSSDARISNALMQIILFITFWPIIIGLWRGRLKEKQLSWNLAVVAYIFQTISVLIAFNGDYLQLAYPVINGIIGNALIPLVIFYKKRRV